MARQDNWWELREDWNDEFNGDKEHWLEIFTVLWQNSTGDPFAMFTEFSLSADDGQSLSIVE